MERAMYCKTNQLNTPNECYSRSPPAFAYTVKVFHGFYSRLKPCIKANEAEIVAPVLSPRTVVSFNAAVLQQCKNNNVDIAAIKIAQTLMIPCLVFARLAFVLGMVLSFVGPVKLRIVPGLSILLAIVLSIVGLLRVMNAPIYALMGKKCEVGARCYMGGVAKTFVIVGIFVGTTSCISLIVSAFCCLQKSKEVPDEEEEGVKVEVEKPQV
mmetsp:Transcript_9871/g.16165  ORF Transcript_9871/g.16165 Transcript_9871/m.16165 type:complete len:211 (+) Transcript_9871:874-1506(+)